MRRPRGEAPAQLVGVRLSPEERRVAEQAAAVNRQCLSDFVRDAVVTAASECLELPAGRFVQQKAAPARH